MTMMAMVTKVILTIVILTTVILTLMILLCFFRVLCNKPVRPPMVSTLQQRWAATGGMPPQ